MLRTPSLAASLLILAAQLSSASVPGLVGGTGDDETLEYLYRLRTFESLPAWPRYYFSDAEGSLLPPGDDAAPCSEAEPCLSAAKMEQILAGHQAIVVLDAGLWDDPADELLGWNGFDFDNTGCGSQGGAGANTMTDEPCAFMIAYDPQRPARFDCEAFSGVQDLKFWLETRGRGSGYLGLAGLRVDRCPEDADGSGTNEWGIHLSNLDGGNGSVVAIDVEVRNIAGFHLHAYRAAGPAHLVLINSAASSRDYADYNSDCSGATCAPNRCTGVGAPYPCCVDAGGGSFQCHGAVHLWEVNSPGHTVISNRTFDVRNTQFELAPFGGSAACFLSDCQLGDCYSSVIGPTCQMAQETPGLASVSFCYTNLGPVDDGAHRYDLARMTCTGFPSALEGRTSGIRPYTNSSSAAKGSVELNLFQNTITGVYTAIRVAGHAYGDTATIKGRCNLFDGLPTFNKQAYVVFGNTPSDGRVRLDFDGSNVYDVDEGLFPFRFWDAKYALAQQVPAGRPGAPYEPNAGWFGSSFGASEGPLESGGQGIDGNVLTPAASCAPGAICEDACQETLLVPLHPSAFVPSAATLANAKITALELGTHYAGVGAPPVAVTVPAAGRLTEGTLALALLALGAGAARWGRRRPRG